MVANHKLLVVEDDQAVRKALADLLEDEGYLVKSVAEGESALALLRGGFRPRAIILDLMMPCMNGWQFRSAQLLDAELSEIPTIIITATGLRKTDRAGAHCLATAHILAKPVSVDDLLHAVQRACTDLH